jgi:glycosyltransferase involved in cell wall biosynthesis
VAVCPVPPYSFYRMSSPIKLYEYMAMGKPVVANVEITEHREVLEESGGGILVSHGPQGFAAGIRTLLEDTSGAAEMGERGRTWVLKNRTYELLADRLNKRLQPLFTGNM